MVNPVISLGSGFIIGLIICMIFMPSWVDDFKNKWNEGDYLGVIWVAIIMLLIGLAFAIGFSIIVVVIALYVVAKN